MQNAFLLCLVWFHNILSPPPGTELVLHPSLHHTPTCAQTSFPIASSLLSRLNCSLSSHRELVCIFPHHNHSLLLVTDQWSGSSSSAFSLASVLSFSISLIRTALAHAWLPLPWRASVVEKIYSSSQYNSNLKFEFKLCHLLHHYKVWFSSASFDLHIFLNQYLLMPSASVSLLREVLSSPPARHISSDTSAFHVIRQCSRLERP